MRGGRSGGSVSCDRAMASCVGFATELRHGTRPGSGGAGLLTRSGVANSTELSELREEFIGVMSPRAGM